MLAPKKLLSLVCYWTATFALAALFWYSILTQYERGTGFTFLVFCGVCMIVISWLFFPKLRSRMALEIREPKWRSFWFFLCCVLSAMIIPAMNFGGRIGDLMLWDLSLFIFYVTMTILHLVCWRVGARRMFFVLVDSGLFVVSPATMVLAGLIGRIFPKGLA